MLPCSQVQHVMSKYEFITAGFHKYMQGIHDEMKGYKNAKRSYLAGIHSLQQQVNDKRECLHICVFISCCLKCHYVLSNTVPSFQTRLQVIQDIKQGTVDLAKVYSTSASRFYKICLLTCKIGSFTKITAINIPQNFMSVSAGRLWKELRNSRISHS